MTLNAIALSAGLGTRLAPYTKQLAKPAIPFLGVPLLIHALRPLDCLTIDKLVINLHFRGDDVRAVCERIKNRYAFHFSDESLAILGSGGGVANAKKWLQTHENFIVVNGDEVFIPLAPDILKKAFELHVQSKNLATLITIDHPEVGKKFGGVWCDPDHRVVNFSKTPIPDTVGLHYTGYLFLNRKIFDYCAEPPKDQNLLYDILKQALINGERVYAFKTTAHWFEIGNPIDFVRSTEKIIALYEKNPTSDFSRNLSHFLTKNTPWSVVVENDFSSTLQKLNKFLNSIQRK